MEIDYGKILRRSWELTRKNRWLMVVGLVLVTFGGGGSNGNFDLGDLGDSSNNSTNVIQNIRQDFNFNMDSNQVLGASVSAIGDWFSQVSPATWALLGLGVLLLFLMGLVISVVIRNWAKGSMIYGLELADSGKTVNLPSMSPQGISSLKKLIILSVVNGLIYFAAIMVFAVVVLISAIVSAFSPALGGILIGLEVLIGLIALVIGSILLAFTNIYAERLIVFHGQDAWPAWKKGFNYSKKYFGQTFKMGLADKAIGCSVGCLSGVVAISIIAFLFILLFSKSISEERFIMPSIPAIIISVIIFLAVSVASTVISAGLMVFNYGNWNLFVKEVFAHDKPNA